MCIIHASHVECAWVSASVLGRKISNFGEHVDLREGIFNIIDSILNQSYWEGAELQQQINFIRNLRDGMNYSENWIKELVVNNYNPILPLTK